MTHALPLPDPEFDRLYTALLTRDARLDGQAWVGVTSTGILCRLTCPARKPKPENCRFFNRLSDGLAAGFRPCKRCHPLAATPGTDPLVARLLSELDTKPDHRWTESDIAALGVDPSTARRAFHRAFGMTFLDMARHRRLARGFTTLRDGGRVIEAQLEAGYDSPSAFRAAFAGFLGVAPGHLRHDALLRADWIDTALGPMIAVSDARALLLLEFANRKALQRELQRLHKGAKGQLGLGRYAPIDRAEAELTEYFAGTRPRFTVPLAPPGTPFQTRVWDALQTIPAGQTRSYGQLAEDIGQPTATRAVARANGANQIALMIPCHRVIGADGALTGYGGGLWRKHRLIELERSYA